MLCAPLRRALAGSGYARPMPIQEKCIPALLEGCDLLGCAQTGTGKTAAFALPILQRLYAARIRPSPGRPQALILAPTRELAAQIDRSFHRYGRYLPMRHAVLFGGVPQSRQVRDLERGVHVLVATPGRLLDLIRQGHVRLDAVQTLVLDEADRMLDMGFIPDIREIARRTPKSRQTLFFSATMDPKMIQLAGEMVRNPVQVRVNPGKPAVERIVQKILFVQKKDKNALLKDLLKSLDGERVLVFTQMKHTANRVVEKLRAAGIESTAIHGNKSQAARTRALDGFRRGHYSVLVATDVAARGLDVRGITHVINYDLPVEAETYIHRIGRTARAGAAGEALSFCSVEDRAYLRDIERLLGGAVPAESRHPYHSEEARRSTAPRPAPPGRRSRNGANCSRNIHRGGSSSRATRFSAATHRR